MEAEKGRREEGAGRGFFGWMRGPVGKLFSSERRAPAMAVEREPLRPASPRREATESGGDSMGRRRRAAQQHRGSAASGEAGACGTSMERQRWATLTCGGADVVGRGEPGLQERRARRRRARSGTRGGARTRSGARGCTDEERRARGGAAGCGASSTQLRPCPGMAAAAASRIGE